jgi:hypothetical protein
MNMLGTTILFGCVYLDQTGRSCAVEQTFEPGGDIAH